MVFLLLLQQNAQTSTWLIWVTLQRLLYLHATKNGFLFFTPNKNQQTTTAPPVRTKSSIHDIWFTSCRVAIEGVLTAGCWHRNMSPIRSLQGEALKKNHSGCKSNISSISCISILPCKKPSSNHNASHTCFSTHQIIKPLNNL